MAAIPKGPLGRDEVRELARFFSQRLRKHVGLEVWTRVESGLVTPGRDVNAHTEDTLALMRQLATLSPAFTVTPYDLDRFADRAVKEGISLSPTVVVRGSGRAIALSGLFYGPLFGPFVDIVSFASAGVTPIAAETRAALAGLEQPVEIEAFVSPFDPTSPQLVLLLGAFAVEGKRLRVRLVEASQYPTLASQRMVTTVPVVWINSRRFEGFWSEEDLVEQVRRIAAGSEEVVVRDRILNAEYLSEDAARALAEKSSPSPASSSGLILPGQS